MLRLRVESRRYRTELGRRSQSLLLLRIQRKYNANPPQREAFLFLARRRSEEADVSRLRLQTCPQLEVDYEVRREMTASVNVWDEL